MTLVRFAGYDPNEGKPGYYQRKTVTSGTSRRRRAYNMFLLGSDTFDIAQRMRVNESRVLKWISIERANHKRLPAPYAGRIVLEEA